MKASCLVMFAQSLFWIVGGPFRYLTDDHSKPNYHHDHEHCSSFVIISALLSLWFTSNIIIIVATKKALTETNWAVNLLGLPPALLGLVAVLMASFSVITYANHDEVTFQASFELGCGLVLFTIAAYCRTYLEKGIQYPWIRSWLFLNGVFLGIFAYTLHVLGMEYDKYICYTALTLFTFGYFNLSQVHAHQN
eukprot:TRINITY_DN4679_c0_g1_i1.p1 TRINITY_DN4679_c0_g1~~TRINITY_DN4679_c0_g1_i1.p1  ORF type:complete len:200 (-),score=12.63 TRINITY_DN4679_c0_g1_i1:67-645(-)